MKPIYGVLLMVAITIVLAVFIFDFISTPNHNENAQYNYQQPIVKQTAKPTPKPTPYVDYSPIFDEAKRLNQLCNNEIATTTAMMNSVWNYEGKRVSDKALVMSVVTQAQRQDITCKRLGDYAAENLNVLNTKGDTKNWASKVIDNVNNNLNNHNQWYQELNNDMSLTIQPSTTRVIYTGVTTTTSTGLIVYTTYTETETNNVEASYDGTYEETPEEWEVTPGDEVPLDYSDSGNTEINNALKACADASPYLTNRAGVSNARNKCSYALSVVQSQGRDIPEYNALINGLQQLIESYDAILANPYIK